MPRAVTISNMAFRLLWIVNVILGILDAFTPVGNQQNGGATSPWVGAHMVVGILLVALLWFIGVAEGLQSRNVLFPLITFVVGLFIPIIGIVQTIPADHTVGQYSLQGLHIVLIVGAIGLAEVATRRYKRALASATAVA